MELKQQLKKEGYEQDADFPALISDSNLAEIMTKNHQQERKHVFESQLNKGVFSGIKYEEKAKPNKFAGFESEWPEHKLALAAVSCNFPTLNPAMVQKVYDRVQDPVLV